MITGWINHSLLTDRIEIVDESGKKIHDLIPQNADGEDAVELPEALYPVLYSKLPDTTTTLTALDFADVYSISVYDTSGSGIDVVTDSNTAYSNYFGIDSDYDSVYVEIDLLEEYVLSGIHIWRYYSGGRSYLGTHLDVSTDGEVWVRVYDYDVEGSYAETSEGKAFTFSDTPVRYIRSYAAGSDSNGGSHWVEIQAYMLPNKQLPQSTAVGAVKNYRIVADPVTRELGDVWRDTVETYYESGVDKYTALLADGSAIYSTDYPEYFDTLDRVVSEDVAYLCICDITKPDHFVYQDFTDTGATDWETAYGRTYGEGKGVFEAMALSDVSGTVTLSGTYTYTDDIFMRPDIILYATNTQGTDELAYAKVLIGTEYGEIVLELRAEGTGMPVLEITQGDTTYVHTATSYLARYALTYDSDNKEYVIYFREAEVDSTPISVGSVDYITITTHATSVGEDNTIAYVRQLPYELYRNIPDLNTDVSGVEYRVLADLQTTEE